MVRVSEPIVVLGAPRSGTTLIADLLGSHPGSVRTREARLVWRYGNDRKSDELGPADATPAVVAHINAWFADIVAASGRRLVEKTPANSVRPWFVDTVFDRARYVHITRDGWACVPAMRDFWDRRGSGFDAKQRAKARRRVREAQLRQLPAYTGELVRRVIRRDGATSLYGPRLAGLSEVVRQLGRLEAAALQWRVCVDRASTFGAEVGDRYFEVKLEELTPDTMRSVVEFCGLAPDDGVVERFTSVYDPQAALRRPAIDDDERRRIAPMVVPTNAWLGYGR